MINIYSHPQVAILKLYIKPELNFFGLTMKLLFISNLYFY
ncbi:hypothetical protein DCCM_2881 [Desulfocucumis palustris]|uniref:Uncharacterized protein n=1 Tax=Desulfocucumis palustris TaxID=1898651 RepID=A0A2L2XIN1_9FIRM|nr:hypothetical protein DCCM_2881 [Desulfocucumis palustris]